ncbi:hypothetical protein D3Z30_13225 [Staphylococcus warneri]|uniref:PPIase cyclophilin-type domain-containing protein n=1 Tax=Staphylococcus warneri TaxID=1292 RepID=A0AB36BLK0_STAWA|nr:hypothetical protein [Staphylococcus warneri]
MLTDFHFLDLLPQTSTITGAIFPNNADLLGSLGHCSRTREASDRRSIVFGQVVEGYEIVKEIEKVGSGSGRTSKPVVVADCGQL